MTTATTSRRQVQREPKPCNLSNADIERVAEAVALRLNYQIGSDLEPVVAKLGGVIEYQGVDDWLAEGSDEIVVKADGSFTIYLSDFSGPLRDRFTIAHEIGHFVLHSRMGHVPIRVRRDGTGPLEVEANRFAAALLMPAAAFKAEASKIKDTDRLAAIFLVSPAAADIRLKSLGLSKSR